MEFIADFHIHSKHSRATSKDMDLDHLARWAKLKGISLLGTGDFTHHLWLEGLKSKLEPDGEGIFSYLGVKFILTAEVSNTYFKNGRGRRVHNIIFAPDFKNVDRINRSLDSFGSLSADGRPMLKLDCASLVEIILGVNPECFIVPAHIWTPWYSLFGANSGFNAIEECFEKYTKDIYALETGLSSDPAMNRRWSELDRFSLISNSDSHSPSKIGREANAFNCKMEYSDITDSLKENDKKRFLRTIEFFPQEGKYHFDGHRNCGVCFSPKQTKEVNNKCPKCNKPLTVGVMNRVVQLSDRPEGFIMEGSRPFKNLIPLDEIIAAALGVGSKSLAVRKEYRRIIQTLGNELEVLSTASEKNLLKTTTESIAQGILRVRRGEVNIYPGYDGEYGKIEIFSKEDEPKEKQLSFF